MNNARIGLAACGVIVAFVAAGCGPSSTSGHSNASGGSGGIAAPSNTQPSWAKSLGPGVTVAGPGSAMAGDGSPAGVFLAEIKDLQSGHYADVCSTAEPSQRATCKSQFDSVPATAIKAYLPAYKNIATTYTAIDGDKALVGITGSVCFPDGTPKCDSNTDPAAIFDSGKSFATLWGEATKAKSNGYELGPFIKVDGAWYIYSSSI